MNKLKTVWDAVNGLRGNINNVDLGSSPTDNLLWLNISEEDYITLNSNPHINPENYQLIGTIAEFSTLVEEMKTGLDVNSVTNGEFYNYFNADKSPLEPLVKIYTQDMADKGIKPSIGMKCLINFLDVDNAWYEYIIDFIGNYTLIASCKDVDERFAHLDDVHFKPIDTRTTKEKAIDELISDLGRHNDNEYAKDLLSKAYDKFSGK